MLPLSVALIYSSGIGKQPLFACGVFVDRYLKHKYQHNFHSDGMNTFFKKFKVLFKISILRETLSSYLSVWASQSRLEDISTIQVP